MPPPDALPAGPAPGTHVMTIGRRRFEFAREVAVMAIVNRTTDSFYDGGRTYTLDAALAHALQQVEDGADIIDVGGVKAGPGAPVGVQQELERVVTFVHAFRQRSDAAVSVDTFRAPVAEAALAVGADMVNDTSGLSDPDMAPLLSRNPGAALVLMHAGGAVRTRPFRNAYLPDVTAAVAAELRGLADEARRAGVAANRIVLDPGHDFRKNTLHSLALTRDLPALCALGYPVLVALSNKDFLGEAVDLPLDQRVEASVAAACVAVMRGARLLRVHETRATARAVRTVGAIMGWHAPARTLRGME